MRNIFLIKNKALSYHLHQSKNIAQIENLGESLENNTLTEANSLVEQGYTFETGM